MILPGVGDGAEQPHLIDGDRARTPCGGQQLRQQIAQRGDERVVSRQRISDARQAVENLGHVADALAGDDADAIVVKPADPHGAAF